MQMEREPNYFSDPALKTHDLSPVVYSQIMPMQPHRSPAFSTWPNLFVATSSFTYNILLPYEIVTDKTVL